VIEPTNDPTPAPDEEGNRALRDVADLLGELPERIAEALEDGWAPEAAEMPADAPPPDDAEVPDGGAASLCSPTPASSPTRWRRYRRS
jgi:hypothetical protein